MTLPSSKEMERAYKHRDTSYDGVFFLAVRTTGVFCRPSCPARKPLSFNVKCQKNGSVILSAGYALLLGLNPGDRVDIAHDVAGAALQLAKTKLP